MKYYQIESKIAIKYPMLFRHFAIFALLVDGLFFFAIDFLLHLIFAYWLPKSHIKEEWLKWKTHISEQFKFAFYVWHTNRGIIVHNPNWKYYLKVMGVWVVVAFVIFLLYGLFADCGYGIVYESCN